MPEEMGWEACDLEGLSRADRDRSLSGGGDPRMNRRSFLKSLVAVAVATQAPAVFLRPSLADVVWRMEKFDYEMQIGVAAKVGSRMFAVSTFSTGDDDRDIAYLKKELTNAL